MAVEQTSKNRGANMEKMKMASKYSCLVTGFIPFQSTTNLGCLILKRDIYCQYWSGNDQVKQGARSSAAMMLTLDISI